MLDLRVGAGDVGPGEGAYRHPAVAIQSWEDLFAKTRCALLVLPRPEACQAAAANVLCEQLHVAISLEPKWSSRDGDDP